jgi:hypothetical protein
MPESPDFDEIARQFMDRTFLHGRPLPQDIAEQLRLIWNARGAADRAAEVMLRPRCATCRFWLRDARGESVFLHGFSQCLRGDNAGSLIRGRDEQGSVVTHETFGCVQWEART